MATMSVFTCHSRFQFMHCGSPGSSFSQMWDKYTPHLVHIVRTIDFLQFLQRPLPGLWTGKWPILSNRTSESGAFVTLLFCLVISRFSLSSSCDVLVLHGGRPRLRDKDAAGLLATTRRCETWATNPSRSRRSFAATASWTRWRL